MSGRHRRGRQRPLHEQDQAEAAVREVADVMQHMADGLGVGVDQSTNDSPDDPTMTAFITELRRDVDEGRVRHCPHLSSPQPIFINAWDRPRVVRCMNCWSASPKPDGLEDVTCDTCGRVDPTGIWPAQVAMGALVLSLGRCDDCTPEHVKNRPKA